MCAKGINISKLNSRRLKYHRIGKGSSVCLCVAAASMEAKFVIYISINFLGILTFYLTYPNNE